MVQKSSRENWRPILVRIYIFFTCPVKDNKRIRKKIRFIVGGWEDLEANIRTAERWLKMILWLVKDLEIEVETINGNITFIKVISASPSSLIIIIIDTGATPPPNPNFCNFPVVIVILMPSRT